METYGQTMALLCEIYYDLTCQDVAPEFEDLHARFFDASEGWFLKLMAWDPKELEVDVSFYLLLVYPFVYGVADRAM